MLRLICKRYLAAFLLVVGFATMSAAADITYIDKRIRSEPIEYAVAISSRDDSAWGHAFVHLIHGDDVRNATVFRGVGFYPVVEDDNDDVSKLKVAFGSAGEVLDDSWEKADVTLSVLVNKDAFEAAEAVVAQWSKPSAYYLGIQDCTTFTSKIAEAIGLNAPTRVLSPYPIQYVRELVAQNP